MSELNTNAKEFQNKNSNRSFKGLKQTKSTHGINFAKPNSFIQEMNKLNNEFITVDQSELENQELNKNEFTALDEAMKENKPATKVKKINLSQAQLDEAQKTEQELKNLSNKHAKDLKSNQREKVQAAVNENQQKQEAQSQQKYSSQEQNIAQAAQAHDAAKEGNVGEQQKRDASKERENQLANWEQLSTRIVEDTANKAVRVDIPGLHDISTVIVRMQGTSVKVQTIGSGEVVNLINQREGQIKAQLAKRSVRLASIQAFDSKSVNV